MSNSQEFHELRIDHEVGFIVNVSVLVSPDGIPIGGIVTQSSGSSGQGKSLTRDDAEDLIIFLKLKDHIP